MTPSDDLKLTAASLQRRIKKYLPREELTLFLPCPLSLSEVASDELKEKNIGKDIQFNSDGVEVKGDWKSIYQCNLESSIATRVLMRIEEFYVGSYPELFQKIKKIHWEVYIGFLGQFDVNVTAKESRLHHSDNIRKTVGDAITQKLASLGQTATLTQNATPCFYIRIYQDRCQISLDTSGEALYKRGYKQFHGEAPLRENLAAGILRIMKSDLNIFVDPLCGSGTFGFEFLLQKLQMKPGAYRSFSFEKFPYFQENTFHKLKQIDVKHQTDVKVYLNDRNKECLEGLMATAKFLDLEKYVITSNYELNSFFKSLNLKNEYLMLSNMPYGKRIEDESEALKKFLAFTRQRKIGGPYGFLALSAQVQALKVGLAHRLSIKNGGLSVVFCYNS